MAYAKQRSRPRAPARGCSTIEVRGRSGRAASEGARVSPPEAAQRAPSARRRAQHTSSEDDHSETPASLRLPPIEAARQAHLRYVSDSTPGIRRRRAGASSTYVAPDGATVRDPATIARIRSLAIPPAWTDVWICPQSNGHIQATGRDQRGRKQYRYHPRWREVRDESKYGRMIAFAHVLPRIRERVDADLRRPGLPRQKVLAAVVRLLETTAIRVGNEEYARTNKSFGLTTMRDRHVAIEGSSMEFTFVGKSGKQHQIYLRDRRLASVVKRCRDIPGYELFQYIDDDGERQTIDAADVNAYLREASGEDFTAKDFRTWSGTVLAALALQEVREFDSEAQAKRNVVAAIETVARQLGNTAAVCRKCYVHPEVLNAYLDGDMLEELEERAEELADDPSGLDPSEAAVLGLLRRRLAIESSAADTRAERAKRTAKQSD